MRGGTKNVTKSDAKNGTKNDTKNGTKYPPKTKSSITTPSASRGVVCCAFHFGWIFGTIFGIIFGTIFGSIFGIVFYISSGTIITIITTVDGKESASDINIK